ncbi:N-acyl homoserine lactonase family protein [Treponema primitia]|uniref:N-acyl homoserine lactonase family protein n=1 Tax=Treponema primitia TaxID=88058 RepID=UPI000255571D|nr:N-acyl homoserine lactonase family protein [Treponema primitia]
MESYSIWLVEYGYCSQQPTSSVIYGKHNAGVMHLPFTFLVLKGNGHTIAVDTGYYDEGYGHDLTVKFGIDGMRPIEKSLADIGIRGEEFDTVIITHAHYDHMGGLKAFPNAHFYIQKKELLDWIEVLAMPKYFSGLSAAIDPNDVKRALDLIAKGQLTLVDGPVENLLPGISLVPSFNSHTYGLQLVTIQRRSDTPADRWVFTSDVCYSIENFGEPAGGSYPGPYQPVGFGVGSITEMVRALVTIQDLADHHLDRLIIPHDATMWKNFKSAVKSDGMHIAEIQLANNEKSRLI